MLLHKVVLLNKCYTFQFPEMVHFFFPIDNWIVMSDTMAQISGEVHTQHNRSER